MINSDSSFEDIERAFRSQVKHYDPEITGSNENAQLF
jgi:molecular chaperone DnaJ